MYKGKYVFTSSITKINPTRPKADIREFIFRIKFKRECAEKGILFYYKFLENQLRIGRRPIEEDLCFSY